MRACDPQAAPPSKVGPSPYTGHLPNKTPGVTTPRGVGVINSPGANSPDTRRATNPQGSVGQGDIKWPHSAVGAPAGALPGGIDTGGSSLAANHLVTFAASKLITMQTGLTRAVSWLITKSLWPPAEQTLSPTKPRPTVLATAQKVIVSMVDRL